MPIHQNSHQEEYILTLNAMGYMTKTLDWIQTAFLSFAKAHIFEPFLEIGCAYGNVALPLLHQGNQLMACDLDSRYAHMIKEELASDQQARFTFQTGVFPEQIDLEDKRFRGILMAMVLHFLPPQRVAQTFQKLAHHLSPQGKLFITASSPYQGVLEDFIPIYEERKQAGQAFPGLIDDITLYVPQRKNDLPKLNILYAPDEICVLCQSVGLKIHQSGYFSRQGIPADIAKNGKEYAFVIAEK